MPPRDVSPACAAPYSAQLSTGYWCAPVSWPGVHWAAEVCWYRGELSSPYLLHDAEYVHHLEWWRPLGWIETPSPRRSTDCALPVPPVLVGG